ncbi:hypothetical protein [Desulfolutivibrio sulfoxidireducens]|uniref:hypothetical protein n=1 Tax=Desulfolutivibrio sulfoxidireducens TaxID=2773299 RepID=UPI00159D125F|nr:hypothetical protein [Desulfolutivibrio sulfoxidireducens]QLA18550.1 hypothetical protein GD604_01805 [Desulfolutivibrio sulfoxidireducens]
MDIRAGDRISSRRHKGELVVAVCGRRVLVCRKVKKDGSPGDQEVLVRRDEVACVRVRLPLA